MKSIAKKNHSLADYKKALRKWDSDIEKGIDVPMAVYDHVSRLVSEMEEADSAMVERSMKKISSLVRRPDRPKNISFLTEDEFRKRESFLFPKDKSAHCGIFPMTEFDSLICVTLVKESRLFVIESISSIGNQLSGSRISGGYNKHLVQCYVDRVNELNLESESLIIYLYKNPNNGTVHFISADCRDISEDDMVRRRLDNFFKKTQCFAQESFSKYFLSDIDLFKSAIVQEKAPLLLISFYSGLKRANYVIPNFARGFSLKSISKLSHDVDKKGRVMRVVEMHDVDTDKPFRLSTNPRNLCKTFLATSMVVLHKAGHNPRPLHLMPNAVPDKLITHCPSCGSLLKTNGVDDNPRCTNFSECREIVAKRILTFVEKFEIPDIDLEFIRKHQTRGFRSFSDYLRTPEHCSYSKATKTRIREILKSKIHVNLIYDILKELAIDPDAAAEFSKAYKNFSAFASGILDKNQMLSLGHSMVTRVMNERDRVDKSKLLISDILGISCLVQIEGGH